MCVCRFDIFFFFKYALSGCSESAEKVLQLSIGFTFRLKNVCVTSRSECVCAAAAEDAAAVGKKRGEKRGGSKAKKFNSKADAPLGLRWRRRQRLHAHYRLLSALL